MATDYNQISDTELGNRYEMRRCPFDRNHIIKMSRYQRHVFECIHRMNASDRNKWKNCPFNASHWVPNEEYNYHVITCGDNRPFIRDFGSAFDKFAEEMVPKVDDIIVKSEPLVEINDQIIIKEESDKKTESSLIPNTPKERVEDEWFDPEVEDYNYYQKPDNTSADHFIKDDNYWHKTNGFVDSISYTLFSKPERKRLNNLMVEKQRAVRTPVPPIKKEMNPHFNFHPLTRVTEQNEYSSGLVFCNPVLNYMKERAEAPLIPITESMVSPTQPLLCNSLHSVEIPVNWKRLVLKETERRLKNIDSEVSTALRGVELYSEFKTEPVKVDKPLRIPTSNPFGRLRRPNTQTIDDKMVLKTDLYNN